MCMGCLKSKSEVPETDVQEQVTVEISEVCVVNDETTIADDFKVFNLETKEQNNELSLSDMVLMFPTEEACYLYFSMPLDQETYAYKENKEEIIDIESGIEVEITDVEIDELVEVIKE